MERLDQELTNLPAYFQSFQKYTEASGYGKILLRQLFTSAMLHIYNPGVYLQPKNDLVMLHGFVRTLATTIRMNEGETSRLIRQVILNEKVYEDYKDQVTMIVSHISSLKQLPA
jgi:hypothetical protein